MKKYLQPLVGAVLLAILPVSTAAADLLVPSDYATIQGALNAASSGDTIHIAPGEYYEQILISNKSNITIVGDSGTVLHPPSDLTPTLRPSTSTRAIVGLLRSEATLKGLTVDGDQIGDIFPPSSGQLQGVFFVGSSGKVQDCIIRNFRGSTLTEYSGARGLIIWNPVRAGGPAEVNVQVISNTFFANETSIAIAGDDDTNPTLLRTRFTIEGSTFTGFGGEVLATDGLAIWTGASGVVRGNTFENFNYAGTTTNNILAPFSSGVAVLDGMAGERNPPSAVQLKPVRIEANIFKNNDEHLVFLHAPQAEIVNNVFSGSGPVSRPWGALVLSGLNQVVANNNFADMPTGIFLFGSTNRVLANWPSVGVPRNTTLTGNWFSNVSRHIHYPPQALVGLQDLGTETNDFRPRLVAIEKPSNAPVETTIRSWHGDSVVIESSTDLRQWTPLSTNSASRPLLDYVAQNSAAPAHEFFRLRKNN